ncbi:ribose-5-phosphate isomerase RpiA [Spirochaeta dissipatitropha]
MSGSISNDELKRLVGAYAVDHYVQTGMKVGLGTGSTAVHAVRRLAERIAAGELSNMLVVPTSLQTLQLSQELGLAVRSMNDPDIAGSLDVAIDGADEVDPDRCLIKGGGAAHLLEKIVEYTARDFIVIVDESKLVDRLAAAMPIPLEVIPEARVPVMNAVKALGGQPTLRMALRKAGPVVTDSGNLIIDVLYPESLPNTPAELERLFNLIPGVVENGLFTRAVKAVVVGRSDGRVDVL